MDSLNFSSIENIPGINAKAIFKVDSSAVFKEDAEMITPVPVGEHLSYMPWGGDNMLPYNIVIAANIFLLHSIELWKFIGFSVGGMVIMCAAILYAEYRKWL